MALNTTPPKRFGILLYPGFEALDAFGPMEVVNDLSREHDITLSVIAASRDPVSTLWKGVHKVGQSVMPTHTFADDPELDVLLIPGGWGGFESDAATRDYIRQVVPKLGSSLITVCNGSALVAQTGILDGKTATTNKAYWKECTASGPKTSWVAKARWVRDGNIWTSSGVSAGIDVTLAFVATYFGEDVATSIANNMEFSRAPSSTDDPFASLYKCQDVPPVSS
ncbi:hypothetical protein PFICI_12362 [Pestalotiopsis fici W106-1]|uniref:DJ-1/PfpI domain-containing protein n=1 Tax=Pestalotiopsis fici (strain W106-1 / CGMCC3.15140) TaxID=1229662 RepID=W3WNI4_PESFW|nr:uncharacterized protein PFICI_12362 [Pestalotiopsis fici W106-1]ETS75418.1 hypothetical protein PFICI_12362 [Pestalotiopsis fici W106-1]